MAVLFALIAAAAYGVSDFVGGLASRRVTAVNVLLVSYPVGGVIMALALLGYGGPVSLTTLLWSIAGGATGLLGVGMLYSALAQAPMNIVSPITAVMAAVVPVVAGVLRGERPAAIAWLGIVLGLLAVVLISREPSDVPNGRIGLRPVLMAVVAGIGFGLYFVCLASADQDSGLWPVVISRAVSALLIVPMVFTGGRYVRMAWPVLRLAAAAGALDATANVGFLLASRHGLLSLAGVITSLYPAGTVALAMIILKERTAVVQRAGLGLAAVAVVLITR